MVGAFAAPRDDEYLTLQAGGGKNEAKGFGMTVGWPRQVRVGPMDGCSRRVQGGMGMTALHSNPELRRC
ncbi:hypothetical protein O9K51_09184 [Purpureocillium lavendulum]|uniref:Uncharacterized protein n=1 Tax=Purpureocillium lavendulum TaxID=1247861 RepID=A0AB34FI37_9HYPO|nr:hypothetical protein O9K51_09184 [Purpureocillium lavendulum]